MHTPDDFAALNQLIEDIDPKAAANAEGANPIELPISEWNYDVDGDKEQYLKFSVRLSYAADQCSAIYLEQGTGVRRQRFAMSGDDLTSMIDALRQAQMAIQTLDRKGQEA